MGELLVVAVSRRMRALDTRARGTHMLFMHPASPSNSDHRDIHYVILDFLWLIPHFDWMNALVIALLLLTDSTALMMALRSISGFLSILLVLGPGRIIDSNCDPPCILASILILITIIISTSCFLCSCFDLARASTVRAPSGTACHRRLSRLWWMDGSRLDIARSRRTCG